MNDAQTTAPVLAASPARVWGYAATLAWTVLAIFVGQMVAYMLALVWRPAALSTLMANYDGALITVFIVISNLVTFAILMLAISIARSNIAGYLALKWPAHRQLVFGVIWLIILIACSDGALYLGGKPLVTPFQAESYASAAMEGWLPAFLIAAILIAPAGEEVVFRGFLFRGWVRSARGVWPAIVAISLLWAGLHEQYEWVYIAQIFIFGLFFGWVRWRSGSILLTFVLHALLNLEGMIETALHAKFFS